MRLYAIINARAGSVLGLDHAALSERLQTALGGGENTVTIELIDPSDLAAALARGIATNPDAVVIGGGDGTVRSAATMLKDSSIALGILPLGTLNRLARDLEIPLDLESAAQALAHARITEIDMGELNGRPFLCNSLIGLPPIYSRQRQRQRGQPLLPRIRGYASVLRHIARSSRKITIDLDDGTAARRVRALSIAISNNVYADAAGVILKRPALDRGELGIYVSRHENGFGMALAFVRAMLGRWRNDPNLEARVARKVQINAKKTAMRVSCDGEVEIIETPLRYRSLPKALKVLAPQSQTDLQPNEPA